MVASITSNHVETNRGCLRKTARTRCRLHCTHHSASLVANSASLVANVCRLTTDRNHLLVRNEAETKTRACDVGFKVCSSPIENDVRSGEPHLERRNN